MTTLNEQFERLSANPQDYDRLYDSENLYVVWRRDKAQSTLENFVNSIDDEYYMWREPLNGSARKDAKIGRDSDVIQGYIFSVSTDQLDLFEKVALMPSIKYSYQFEKYDINAIKKQEQQDIIDALSEEE